MPSVRSALSKVNSGFMSLLMVLAFFSALGSIAGMEFAFGFMVIAMILLAPFKAKDAFKEIPLSLYYSFGSLLIFIMFQDYFVAPQKFKLTENIVTARFSLVFFAIVFTFRNQLSKLKSWSFLFHLHLLWICSFAVYQAFTGHVMEHWQWTYIDYQGVFRPRGFFINTMTYSYVFSMWFVFLLAWTLNHSKHNWRTNLLRLSLFVCATSLILTQTRGMWIAVASAFVLYFYHLRKKINLKKLIPATLVFIIILFSSVTPLRTRVMSIFEASNSSNSMRVELWNSHLTLFKERPFLGYGPQIKAQKLKDEYYSKPDQYHYKKISHAHNNFLEIAVRYGLVGLFLYLWVFIGVFKETWRKYKESLNTPINSVFLGSMGAQVVFHVGGLTECTFLDYEVVYGLTLIIALGFLNYKKNKMEA